MSSRNTRRRREGRVTLLSPRSVALLSAVVTVTALLFKVWPF